MNNAYVQAQFESIASSVSIRMRCVECKSSEDWMEGAKLVLAAVHEAIRESIHNPENYEKLLEKYGPRP